MQWTWILSILFAIIIAVFSVMNVDSVKVNYVFGTAEWPLVLVILGAALLGAAVSGFIALFRSIASKHNIKEMKQELLEKERLIESQLQEITDLKKKTPKIIDKRPVVEPTIKNDETVIELEKKNKLE